MTTPCYPGEGTSCANSCHCFCFTEQSLKAGEKRDMAVVFYVDPSMATDPDGREINSITLSYTFYPQREPLRPVADGTPAGRPKKIY